MAEGFENANQGNPFEILRHQEYVDITNGLPFSSAQNLYDFIWDSVDNHDTARFPIVGLSQSDGRTRVYMLLKNTRNGKQDHHSLLSRLGLPLEKLEQDASSVAFSTSLEGLSHEKPNKGSFLELTAQNEYDDNPQTKYVPLGRGSDLIPLYNHQFTDEGKRMLAGIFGRLNIQVRTD